MQLTFYVCSTKSSERLQGYLDLSLLVICLLLISSLTTICVLPAPLNAPPGLNCQWHETQGEPVFLYLLAAYLKNFLVGFDQRGLDVTHAMTGHHLCRVHRPGQRRHHTCPWRTSKKSHLPETAWYSSQNKPTICASTVNYSLCALPLCCHGILDT